MEAYEFSHTKIDEHIQKVGVDIVPSFEIKLDSVKLNDVGTKLRDKYPQFFESLVQSPSQFRIMKKYYFSGKSKLEVATLTTNPRGIVFTFPKLIAAIGEEIEVKNIADTVVDCLSELKQSFPQKKIVRIGLVNEYIFSTKDINACGILCDRFLKLPIPSGSDVQLRINLRTDEYNRVIEMKPVQKVQPVPEISGRMQNVGYGLRVKVDFNNIEVNKDLDDTSIFRTIHDAQRYNENNLYEFLNGKTGGE